MDHKEAMENFKIRLEPFVIKVLCVFLRVLKSKHFLEIISFRCSETSQNT